MMVLWGDDGHASKYETDWLRSYALDVLADGAARPDTVLWDSALSGAVPRFDYGAIMDSEEGLGAWLTALLSHGIAFGLGYAALRSGGASGGGADRLCPAVKLR